MLPAGRRALDLSTVPVKDAVKNPLFVLEARPFMGTPPFIGPSFELWQVAVLVDEEFVGHLCDHEVLGAVHVLAKTFRLSCSKVRALSVSSGCVAKSAGSVAKSAASSWPSSKS